MKPHYHNSGSWTLYQKVSFSVELFLQTLSAVVTYVEHTWERLGWAMELFVPDEMADLLRMNYS